jgi:regulator of cell morphogenesis and NO signaling
MKVADLVDSNSHLLGVLSRMGIPMGLGDATVEETCRLHGVDTDTFLLICNMYSFRDYIPSEEEMTRLDPAQVVSYLKQSHIYYREDALVTLADAIRHMLEPCEERRRRFIRTFYDDYTAELEKHFAYEEANVFPFAEAIIRGDTTMERFYQIEAEHTDIEAKIGDLKRIILKYPPSECRSADIQQVLNFLYFLDEDLTRHNMVEDRLLGKETPAPAEGPKPKPEGDELSAREKEILICVAKGMLNKQIADLYNISIYTVITHRKNITRKTGIKSVAGLTIYALLNNLIDMSAVE